MAKEKV